MQKQKPEVLIPFSFQRITRRQGGLPNIRRAGAANNDRALLRFVYESLCEIGSQWNKLGLDSANAAMERAVELIKRQSFGYGNFKTAH